MVHVHLAALYPQTTTLGQLLSFLAPRLEQNCPRSVTNKILGYFLGPDFSYHGAADDLRPLGSL